MSRVPRNRSEEIPKEKEKKKNNILKLVINDQTQDHPKNQKTKRYNHIGQVVHIRGYVP